MAWTEEDEARLQELEALESQGSGSFRYGATEEEEEEVEKNERFAADAIDLIQAGWDQGWADTFGGVGLTSLEEWFQEGADEQLEEVSQATLDSMSSLGFSEDKEMSARGLAAIVLQSGGQIGTYMIPGTAVGKAVSAGTRAVSGISKANKALSIAKANDKIKTVKKLEESLTAANKRIDKFGQALGYGSVSASQFYEQAADEVEQRIEATDDDTLINSDVYFRELYSGYRDQGDPDAFSKAKQSYIDDKRIEVGLKNALVGFFTGGALSPAYTSIIKETAAKTVAGGLAKGGLTESGQEFVQEGSGALIIKEAIPLLAGDIVPWDRAAIGAVAGGLAGGSIAGGVTHMSLAQKKKAATQAEASKKEAEQAELSRKFAEVNALNADVVASGKANDSLMDSTIDLDGRSGAAAVDMEPVEAFNTQPTPPPGTVKADVLIDQADADTGRAGVGYTREPADWIKDKSTELSSELQTGRWIRNEKTGEWHVGGSQSSYDPIEGDYNQGQIDENRSGAVTQSFTKAQTEEIERGEAEQEKLLSDAERAAAAYESKQEKAKLAERKEKVSKAKATKTATSTKLADVSADSTATVEEVATAQQADDAAGMAVDTAVAKEEAEIANQEVKKEEVKQVVNEKKRTALINKLSTEKILKSTGKKQWASWATELGLEPTGSKNTIEAAVRAEVEANYEKPEPIKVNVDDYVEYDGKDYLVNSTDRKDGRIVIQKFRATKGNKETPSIDKRYGDEYIVDNDSLSEAKDSSTRAKKTKKGPLTVKEEEEQQITKDLEESDKKIQETEDTAMTPQEEEVVTEEEQTKRDAEEAIADNQQKIAKRLAKTLEKEQERLTKVEAEIKKFDEADILEDNVAKGVKFPNYTWDAEQEIVVDNEGNEVLSSRKKEVLEKRAEFFEDRGVVDPNALGKESVGTLPLEQAIRDLESFNYNLSVKKDQTTGAAIEPNKEDLAKRFKLETKVTVEKAKRELELEELRAAGKTGTAVVEQTTDTTTEGMDANLGQEEVNLDAAPVVDENSEDFGTPNVELTAEEKALQIAEETSTAVKDIAKAMAGQKRNITLKKFASLTDQERENIEFDENPDYQVTPEVVDAYESSQQQQALEGTDAVKGLSAEAEALPTKISDKIKKSYMKIFGAEEETFWAIENPDKVAVVDELQLNLKGKGYDGGPAFIEAVALVMEGEVNTVEDAQSYNYEEGGMDSPDKVMNQEVAIKAAETASLMGVLERENFVTEILNNPNVTAEDVAEFRIDYFNARVKEDKPAVKALKELEALLKAESVKDQLLYRGRKGKGGTPRYPGTFYSTDRTVAEYYAGDTGRVFERDVDLQNTLDIDNIPNREELLADLEAYMQEAGVDYTNEDTGSYLYDVLTGKETDFAYPIQADSDFLLDRGYDSVKYENEGGVKQDGYFIPKREGDPLLDTRSVTRTDTTVEEVNQEIQDAFGQQFKNVEIVETTADLPAALQDRTNSSGIFVPGSNTASETGQDTIYIVADQVVRGEVKGLILHEKGVHEMLKRDPMYKRSVIAITSGKTAASRQAVSHVDNLINEGAINPDNREEEIIAYFMSENPDAPASRSLISKFKLWFKKTFGMKLTDADVIQIVNDLVTKDVETTQTQTGPILDSINSATVRQAAQADVESSVNKSFQADVLSAPQNLYAAVMDAVFAGNMTGLKDRAYSASHKIKEKWLAYMPQSEVIRDAITKGMDSFSGLEDLENRIRAEAHKNIDRVQKDVLEPVTSLKKNQPEEYKKTIQLMLDATSSNKDMKNSRRFRNLTTEAQGAYIAVENMYKDQQDKYIQSIRNQMESEGMSDGQKAELESYMSIFIAGKDKVYFPLQRFGRYRVDANLDGERYTSFHDNMAEVRAAERELSKQGATSIMFKNKPNYQQYAEQVMDQGAYVKAQSIIEKLGGSPEAKEAMFKTFMHMSAPKKLKDRLKTRQHIAGASLNMVRGVANTIGNYRDIARRNGAAARADIYQRAEDSIEGMTDNLKRAEAQVVLDELKLREDLAGKHRSGLSSGLSKANFLFNLGLNPSSAIINLTQNAIVGIPILGSKFGMVRSGAAITKALTDSSKVLYNMKKGRPPLQGDELDAFKHWQDMGTFDATQAYMHLQLAEGDVEGTKTRFDKGVEMSAVLFHNAELINRITAGLAAYRLAKDSGMSHKGAKEYSSKAIIDIHFDYSEEGKSRIQRGDVGSVLMAFKSYPIKMSYYMVNNLRAMTKGSTPEVKYEAYKQFFGTMSVTAMFGGAMALPMSSVLMLVADLLGDDDEQFDAHTAFREWATEVAGEDGGEILTNGWLSYVTGVDLTGRVSLDKMFFRIPDGGGSPDDWLREAGSSLGGPIAQRIMQMPKALDLMNQGKYGAGMEKMMPSIYANTSKAYRWGELGRQTNSSDVTMDSDFTMDDAFSRFLGFGTTEGARNTETYWTRKRIERDAKEAKTYVLNKASLAFSIGNQDDKSEARILIEKYNNINPLTPITSKSLRSKLKDANEKLNNLGRYKI